MIKLTPADGGSIVAFTLPTDTGDCFVAGSWNGWKTDAMPMGKVNGTTRRALTLLPAGHHEFRYVTADGRWFDDPTIAERRGENCVLEVPAR